MVIFVVLIAHLASAFGNLLQSNIWPEWPHDAPTNHRLQPDGESSVQQRLMWYKNIKDLTGLDIEATVRAGDIKETRAIIKDAIEIVRNQIKNGSRRDRHEHESINYGYARNLTGLRPVWLLFSLVSMVGCWAIYLFDNGLVLWPIMASLVPGLCFYLAFCVLPRYVKTRAHYYSEVFFRLLKEEAKEARSSAPLQSRASNASR